MSNHWEKMWSFQTDHFLIVAEIAPEDMDPADSFDDCCQDAIDAIRAGDMAWFVARVRVLHNGSELGSDYLGGCAYNNASEFFNEHIRGAAYARKMRAKGVSCGSYFPQMVREAIGEARKTPKSIADCLVKLRTNEAHTMESEMTRHYRTKPEAVAYLERIGISIEDGFALRRIAMALHRWHELECGDSNDHVSRVIVRGNKKNGSPFEYDDNGKPFVETHYHRKLDPSPFYYSIPDREAGAKKRLAKIMAKYPTLTAYIQGDPRGASLYIIRPGDVPEGEDVGAYYNRGIAVYK